VKTYPIPMVPGPTVVPEAVRTAYLTDYGSADLEPEYAELYAGVQGKLQQILGTRNPMALMTGEGMAALWGALKSCVAPGDRVLAVATGVFGIGIGDMARQIGAQVETLDFAYDAVADPGQVEAAIRRFRPKLVSAVHCETPSGTMNPIAEIGALVRAYDVPLFYVDAVASAGGAPVQADAWNIDLCLAGTQKCLSAPPNMAIVAVGARAWQAAEDVGYVGYDALLPWHTALDDRWFPYTPSWHDTAALDVACDLLLAEGLAGAFRRHADVARSCRSGLRKLGLEVFPPRDQDSAATVTAVKVPANIGWSELNARFRQRGLAVGGSLGPLDGKVFRLGHMGSQAQHALVDRALAVIADALAR
jgi:aspartate aminotransferase-like enzyme